MKNIFGWVGITTAALFIFVEAASLALNNQPNLSNDSVLNRTLLAQRRRRTRPSSNQQVIRVPIQDRAGGVPVIAVTFNGNRQFPMLVDTGASITTITPEMAKALRFKQEDTIEIIVANGESAEVPVGRVRSIDVGGIVLNNFSVAIASSPLLGQNFYRGYNVTIARNFVVFQPRLR